MLTGVPPQPPARHARVFEAARHLSPQGTQLQAFLEVGA